MAEKKISTGVKTPQGLAYQPKASTTREAMSAFLFRAAEVKGYNAPTTSKFVDMKPSDKFYKEISWMADNKISTGVKTPQGLAYQPKASTTREAMSAFLYRGVAG
jgi:hypothetical protein